VLASTAGPESAVLAAGLLVLLGGLGLATAPALRAVVPHPGAVRGAAGPLTSAAVRGLLLTVATSGVSFGALDVAVVAFSEQHGGRPSTGAVLLAVWSAGSILGGLVYGAVHSPAPHEKQLTVLVATLALGSTLPLLAPGLASMAVLLVLFGTTIAPYSACSSVLLARATPAGTVTEAFAWSGGAIFAGAALGNLLSGLVVEHVGVREALAIPALSGALGLLAGLASRRALTSP
jgi:predicted MFS family arabinose efflux permease